MADTGTTGRALQFSATFPCDERFCPAVADLGAKVAVSLGYPESEAHVVGQAVHRAFEEAIGLAAGTGEVHVDVTLRDGGEAIDATVRWSHRVLLQLTRQRTD
jgi:hypothetical protein